MARTKSATSRRTSKPAASKGIKKKASAETYVEAATPFISDSDAMRIVQRGLTVSEAVALCRIFKCTVAELVGMYKCRKSRVPSAIEAGRQYVSKRGLPRFRGRGGVVSSAKPKKLKARKPPARKSSSAKRKNKRLPPNGGGNEDVTILWIGDVLDSWVPHTSDVEVGQTVLVQAKNAAEQAGTSLTKAVKVTDMYDHKVVLGGRGEVAMVNKWSVVGRLIDPLWVDTQLLAKGVLVRFYVEHVQSVQK